MIASGPNEQLEDFCRRTHTLFRVGAEEDLVEIIEQAYLSLLARYEITYQPLTAEAADLKVRIQTPAGWGETLIAAPRQPDAGS